MGTSRRLDFAGLGTELLGRARELCAAWLPGGRMVGVEYTCGNLRGGQGDSLKVNTKTGRWSDFATGDKGGDLVSLYAAIHGVSQGDAAKSLTDGYRLALSHEASPQGTSRARAATLENDLVPPPETHARPSFAHPKFGNATAVYEYTDPQGAIIHFVARFDPPGERKQFLPYSWSRRQNRFVNRAFPAPRPLYGLKDLAHRKDAPVIVTEGEKAANAAREIAGRLYVVVTWSGGAQAYVKTDFTPLHGRKILLWPDADPPGKLAMDRLARDLHPHAAEIKVIDPGSELPAGWDAADALESGFTWDRFKEWARPRVTVFHPESELNSTPPPSVSDLAQVGSPDPEVLPPSPPDDSPPPQAPEDIKVEDSDSTRQALPNLAARFIEWGVELTNHGNPICNSTNVLKILRHHEGFRDVAWLDEFRQVIMTAMDGAPRPWKDVDDINLMIVFQGNWKMPRLTLGVVRDAVQSLAHMNKRNEPLAWMESLTWDGTPRVERFLETHIGAQDSAFVRAVSRNFWVSMAARILRPGCKVDNMLILEGPQGRYKSTALQIIGGPWYGEVNSHIDTKDFYLQLQGRLLIEFSELDAMSKAEVTTIKKVISSPSDSFRPPYGRATVDFPRMCVFTGSTNEESYLKDHTGARRFWPVKIGLISPEAIARDRDQLFAEAVHLFRHGATWHEVPAEEARAEQEPRRQVDEWEHTIGRWLIGRRDTTLSEVAEEALDLEISRFDPTCQRRVARIMRVLGWRTTTIRRDGRVMRAWVREDDDGIPNDDESPRIDGGTA